MWIAKQDRRYVMAEDEAMALADQLRVEIREGTRAPERKTVGGGLRRSATFSAIAHEYVRRHVQVPTRRTVAARSIAYYVRMLTRLKIPTVGGTVAALGTRPFAAITKADLEAARGAPHRARGRGTEPSNSPRL